MARRKLSDREKLILIYSVELAVFSLVFLVLGFLRVFGVIPTKETRLFIFNIITSAGSVWVLADFIWAVASKKRRARICMLDKALTFPIALCLIPFDIYCFILKATEGTIPSFAQYAVSGLFFYIAVIYGIMAVYHYKHPLPTVLREIEKMEQEQALQEEQAKAEAEKQAGEKYELEDNPLGNDETLN